MPQALQEFLDRLLKFHYFNSLISSWPSTTQFWNTFFEVSGGRDTGNTKWVQNSKTTKGTSSIRNVSSLLSWGQSSSSPVQRQPRLINFLWLFPKIFYTHNKHIRSFLHNENTLLLSLIVSACRESSEPFKWLFSSSVIGLYSIIPFWWAFQLSPVLCYYKRYCHEHTSTSPAREHIL